MATVSAWGNSLGLRLPKYVTERAAIRAGDQVYVRLLDSGEILVRVVKARDIPAVFKPLVGDGVPTAAKPLSDEEVAAQW
ncbi:hypothetical protein G7047_14325 [Diaphorobacter sp. HDW4A]|jgi:antitoxin MazE|uniref:AbrB/MazE/SpoVT family DNA-binding domain-containing protein n=1 Tax=Comamonadaceae TaxID=80864 RepID=UPI00042207F4|nr:MULTISPECIES: AbrB/MazE/SpoVT family DNA-binding domain-containing protein [Comamonadaceae]QIL80942.1 hypothetical protein G7047_14325 [Diaphorobacter sp. HDW4A]